uniref:Fatty acyl-CoA reductase n=2 Tax=Graphocephala atropunctata TaxID=36148 RepID=A0A1B6LEQ3_9HEMI
MDYYEARDDLDEPPLEQSGPSPIQQFYEGAYIFITGASGFMGKVLLEKLLRTCNVAEIYILVRDKKGVKSQERLASILDDNFFDLLKTKKPYEIKKVKIVTGDCSLPGLGLSEEHKALLSHVNVIFHAAATLSMDQHLRVAYITNVVATKFLLEFAKTLSYLKAFMYISTAYTHAYRDLVEEKFYDVVFDEDHIGQLCNEFDDQQIGAMTPKLIGRWGNTYALTKACAENLISKYDKILPIGVIRPSIVVSVSDKPLRGWINNLYGAIGVVSGTAVGLLRLWCADPDMVADMVPVDLAINMTLAASWEVATKNTRLKIYNSETSSKNPMTYDILRTDNFSFGKNLQTTQCIAVQSFFIVKNKTMFRLYTIWYHVIPAFFIDIFLQLTGRKPQLMSIYAKVYNVNKSLMPYCVEKNISFTSNNVDEMWNSLDPVDKRLFNFDLAALDWHEFWLYALKGMRAYLLNDPIETVSQGVKHTRKLWIRKLVFDSIIWTSLSYLAYIVIRKILRSLFV